ncbi:MAG: hypothetical protein IH614_17085 [Desulfuromonadales bacterium]|nr:hypothetical protein [Desulfuromonadales bacterium]
MAKRQMPDDIALEIGVVLEEVQSQLIAYEAAAIFFRENPRSTLKAPDWSLLFHSLQGMPDRVMSAVHRLESAVSQEGSHGKS